MKFNIGDFYDNRSREAKLFTVVEKYRELSAVYCCRLIKSLSKRWLRGKWYQVV